MGEMRISFNFYNCTHVYFKDSSCVKCIDICPIDNVLTLNEGKITLNEERCVNCGACFSICPTESFDLRNFSIDYLVKKIENTEFKVVSCKEDIPCLAAFDPQHVIFLILKTKSSIKFDMSGCDKCELKQLKNRISEIIEEVNYFLTSLDVDQRVIPDYEGIENKNNLTDYERRNFIKDLGKLSAGIAVMAVTKGLNIDDNKEKDDFKNIVEEKVLIDKRRRLIQILKKSNINLEGKKIKTDKVSFTSDKWIEVSKCTNCSICYNLCPTGALKTNTDRLQILFEPSLCVKCHVCHDSCPEKCINISEELDLETFVNGMKILAEHVMIPCEECLVPFSYKGDSTLCPRCRQLSDDIRDLLKLGD